MGSKGASGTSSKRPLLLNSFRLSLPGASATQVMAPVGVGVGFAVSHSPPCLVSIVNVQRTVCFMKAFGWVPRIALEMLRCCMISGGRGTVVKEASTSPCQRPCPYSIWVPCGVPLNQAGLSHLKPSRDQWVVGPQDIWCVPIDFVWFFEPEAQGHRAGARGRPRSSTWERLPGAGENELSVLATPGPMNSQLAWRNSQPSSQRQLFGPTSQMGHFRPEPTWLPKVRSTFSQASSFRSWLRVSKLSKD